MESLLDAFDTFQSSGHGSPIGDALIFLAAAVLFAPLLRRLKFSLVLGYLAAGAMIGPHGLSIIDDVTETRELADIIAHTRRFSIPLIAITKKSGSTLATQADHLLQLPDAPEACAIGMAPTTSTTLTLAIGDALAVAVMELRGFNSEDFLKFHPGGKLGAQLARVSDLMHDGNALPLVDADMPMSEVLITMTSKGFGIAATTRDDGRLNGVITDGDLRRNMGNLMAMKAGEIANPSPVTVTPDLFAAQALALLNDRKIGALMVIDDDGKPVGVLQIHDLLRAGVA